MSNYCPTLCLHFPARHEPNFTLFWSKYNWIHYSLSIFLQIIMVFPPSPPPSRRTTLMGSCPHRERCRGSSTTRSRCVAPNSSSTSWSRSLAWASTRVWHCRRRPFPTSSPKWWRSTSTGKGQVLIALFDLWTVPLSFFKSSIVLLELLGLCVL